MNISENCYTGLGKRKCAVAKVFLTEGTGVIVVNAKSFDEFFSGTSIEREMVKNPFLLVELNNTYDVNVKIHGGGITAQLEAIRLAVSKAICQIDNNYRAILH